ARIYPNRVAEIHGEGRFTYAQFLERARRLASALERAGVGQGDTVAIMGGNTPQMLEAHYAVPMLGAVLCCINIRLDAAAIGFILRHSETKVVLTDTEFAAAMGPAVAGLPVLVVDIDDAGGTRIGSVEYETFLEGGDPAHPVRLPDDEWQAT